MREIKFRAWDKDESKMVYPVGLNWDRGFIVPRSGLSISNYELMQYTGLKDKNGKEIYEGDILKQFNDKLEVFWEKGGFSVKKKDGINKGLTLVPSYLIDCKVIGNIYENPELLTK